MKINMTAVAGDEGDSRRIVIIVVVVWFIL
jgi:hypothetical protein